MDTLTPASPEELQQVYGNITDRDEMWKQLQYEKANNPVFEGLDEKQIGSVINEATGAQPGSRFEVFNSRSRWVDALGYKVAKTVEGAPGSLGGLSDLVSGRKISYTLGDLGSDVGKKVANTFGVTDPTGLAMWENAGRGLPAGLATLALGAIPYVGLPAMVGVGYGRAVNDAKIAGASGQKAFAVGAIDTAVNLLFMKAGAPLADKMAEKALGKVMGDSAVQSLADLSGLVIKPGLHNTGKQINGRALVELAAETGKITGVQKFGVRLAQEVATESIQGVIGSVGQLAHEGILDPEGLKERMANPNYWATMAATQGVFSVVGTTLGRIREPNPLKAYELGAGAQKLAAENVDRLAKDHANVIETAKEEIKTAFEAKEGDDALEPIVTPTPETIMMVGSALQALDLIGLTDNAAQAATRMLVGKTPEQIEGLVAAAKKLPVVGKPALPSGFNVLKSQFSHIEVETPTSAVPNLVFTREMFAAPYEDTFKTLIHPEQQIAFKEMYDFTHAEFQKQVTERTVHYQDTITPEKQLSYGTFLNQTGLAKAAETTKSQIHFTDSRQTKNWLTKFFVSPYDSVSRVIIGDKTMFYVNSNHATRASDLHEIGHVFDYLVDAGGYGEQHKIEWTALKEKFTSNDIPLMRNRIPDQSNILGAMVGSKRGLEVTNDAVTPWSRNDYSVESIQRYYQERGEWAAQAVQGYFLGNKTKFKSFVETNFPKIHELFMTIAQSIKSMVGRKKGNITRTERDSLWNNGQTEANKFFESLFTSFTKKNTAEEIPILLKKYGLDQPGFELHKEALVAAITAHETLGTKPLVLDILNGWDKDFDPDGLQLLDQLASVKQVNESGFIGDVGAAPQGINLPAIQRLMQVDPDKVRGIAKSNYTLEGSKLSTKRKGKPDGLFYGTKVEDVIENGGVANVKDLPTSGRNILTIKHKVLENTGDASNAPGNELLHSGIVKLDQDLYDLIQGKSGMEQPLDTDLLVALQLKRDGYDVVHMVDPVDDTSVVSMNLQHTTEKQLFDELAKRLSPTHKDDPGLEAFATNLIQVKPKVSPVVQAHLDMLKDLPARGSRALAAIDSAISLWYEQVIKSKLEFNQKQAKSKGVAAEPIEKTSYLETQEYLFKVNEVVQKWIVGKLDGQEGRYMWDKGPMRGSEFGVYTGEKYNAREAVEIRQRVLQDEFPILSSAIRKIPRKDSPQEEFVHVNGQEKGEVLKFDTQEEAQEYAKVQNEAGNKPGWYHIPKRLSVAGDKSLSPEARKAMVDAQRVTHEEKGTGKKFKFKDPTKVEKWGIITRKGEDQIGATYFEDEMTKIGQHNLFDELSDEPAVLDTFITQRKEQLENEKLVSVENHVVSWTKQMFAKRRKYEQAFPLKMEQALTWLETYNREYPEFNQRLTSELGIKSKNTEDVLLGLMDLYNKDPQRVKDYLKFSPYPLVTTWKNWVEVVKMQLAADIPESIQMFYAGEVPQLLNDSGVWERGLDKIVPVNDPEFHEAIPILQHADVGGLLRKNAVGITYAGAAPKTLIGKTMSWIEKLHTRSFGGVQNIAETIKEFLPLGNILCKEGAFQDYHGFKGIQCLRGSGEMGVLPDGTKGWITAFGSEKQSPDTYMAINTSQKMKPIAERIMRMQNEAGGEKFSEILANVITKDKPTPDEVKARADLAIEANKLISDNFDLNNPKHRAELDQLTEYLERTYACQREFANLHYESEKEIHLAVTSNAFFRGVDFRGTPEQAKDLAMQYHSIPRGTPETSLAQLTLLTKPIDAGGLGFEDQRALSFQAKWNEAADAIELMRQKMLSTPGFVSEQRLRRWQVSYAQNGKVAGEKPGTGLRDFDTQEEAWAFWKQLEIEGKEKNKPGVRRNTGQQPLDTHLRDANIRTGSDILDEVVTKVVTARQELLTFMLEPLVENGTLNEDQMRSFLKTMSGMSEDISADSVSGRLKGILGKHRILKAGREDLDMAYQQEESFWRSSIKYARKITDSWWELHINDQRLAAYPKERDIFIAEKNAIRYPDGKGQRIASKVAFSYFILGNISSAMIEALQWPLSLSHILIEEGGGIIESFTAPSRLFAKAGRASIKRVLAGSDASIWSPEEFKLIRYTEDSGRLGVRPLNDISTDDTASKIQASRMATNPGATNGLLKPATYAEAAFKSLNHFYAFFSRVNAELCLVAAHELVMKRDYKGRKLSELELQESYEKAIRITNKANGSWGRTNRPWWFQTRSQTGRTAAQLAWSLQGFASNYVANHLRLLRHSFTGKDAGLSKEEVTRSRKALAVMTTLQVAGLGVMGHTLAAGLSKAMTATFGFDPETELKDFLEDKTQLEPEDALAMSDLVSYGAFHALGVPVDFQSRMAVSGLGPLNAYDGWNASSFAGPVMSTLGNLVDGWQTIAKGDGSAASYMRFGTGLLPTGIQRAIRMEMFDDGKVFNKSGRFIMDPTVGEKVAGALGFGSPRYSDYMKAKTKSIEANVRDGVDKSRAAATIRTELNLGNRFRAIQMLNEEAARLNTDPKTLADQVAKLDLVQTFGPQDTIGAGPQAQRAARLYPTALPKATENEKKTRQFRTLSQLNQLPQTWRRQLRQADMRDTAMQIAPHLTPSATRNQLQNPLFKSTVLSVMNSQGASRTSVGLSGFDVGAFQ